MKKISKLDIRMVTNYTDCTLGGAIIDAFLNAKNNTLNDEDLAKIQYEGRHISSNKFTAIRHKGYRIATMSDKYYKNDWNFHYSKSRYVLENPNHIPTIKKDAQKDTTKEAV